MFPGFRFKTASNPLLLNGELPVESADDVLEPVLGILNMIIQLPKDYKLLYCNSDQDKMPKS